MDRWMDRGKEPGRQKIRNKANRMGRHRIKRIYSCFPRILPCCDPCMAPDDDTSHLLQQTVSLSQPPEGVLHIFVAQTVDAGAEYGNDQGVDYGDHLALLHGCHTSWLAIYSKASPIKQGHGCHVRATGGEELVLP